MSKLFVAIPVGLLLSCCVPRPAYAQQPQTSVDRVIDSLLTVRELQEVAISPDGRDVAWVEALPGKDGASSGNSAIFVTGLKSPTQARRITAGSGTGKSKLAHAEHDMAWSPDGSRLAFLSDAAKKGQLQLYVVEAAGGSTRQLTRLTGFLSEAHWSPNGKKLAFLFIESAARAAGPLEPVTKEAGVVEEQIFEQRLTTVDLDSGRVQQVSPADLYVYEYDWSPDSTHFVATAAHGSGDNNWYVAELFVIRTDLEETKAIFKPPLQIAAPRWSPDGKNIAFIGGLMSDEGSPGGDIFILPATGGEPQNITPDMKASASRLAWLPSSKQIVFAEEVDGCAGVARVDLADGKIATLWTGPEHIDAGGGIWGMSASLARDGQTSAIIRGSFMHPPEIWAGPIGAWQQVTHINRSVSPSWGEARSIHWASDGMSMQGWLVYPPNFQPNRLYPLIVDVHGGPSGQEDSFWAGAFNPRSVLPSEGYFVFLPNPRGSFGQGETFTQANVRDLGYGDFRDIMAGVDTVAKNFPIDEKRIGIFGWSYGGYLTMWAVTQTHRFRAAVAGAGISNWQSYYGETEINQWMIPFFGATVYDDPAIYAKSSPMTFIKNVKTPTLILVGDSDGECPPPQSHEFWRALKTLGVETQLVIYPNEGHWPHDPQHARDLNQRTVAWFNQHLQ